MTDVSEQSVAEVLNRAADLLEKPGAWTQGAYIRDSDGEELREWHTGIDLASCFCLYGAIGRVTDIHPEFYNRADRYLMAALGVGTTDKVADFNDNPSRTQAEVVAALRSAALLAAPRAGEGVNRG